MTPRGAKKISIVGQISEIEHDIAQRQRDYPRLVREGRMRQEEAEMRMQRVLAIRETLHFCKRHEADIRAYMASKKAGGAA
ncbi:hypothetical protein [Gellertiella hungarica]|uniref:Uncharacterized protein n=1 Tax=Gellertiella hungarica TaxID=1572859 RepID=A0A7W6J975_9HYPH|nr:hypothetical protein [Gellertiella hungarica]MBB4066246.1 hypothetical protein [Gellertiella hungarica]